LKLDLKVVQSVAHNGVAVLEAVVVTMVAGSVVELVVVVLDIGVPQVEYRSLMIFRCGSRLTLLVPPSGSSMQLRPSQHSFSASQVACAATQDVVVVVAEEMVVVTAG
jgi:hypothetical protein